MPTSLLHNLVEGHGMPIIKRHTVRGCDHRLLCRPAVYAHFFAAQLGRGARHADHQTPHRARMRSQTAVSSCRLCPLLCCTTWSRGTACRSSNATPCEDAITDCCVVLPSMPTSLLHNLVAGHGMPIIKRHTV